jgi:tight adherence protein B
VITTHYARSGELRDRVHAFLPAAQPLVKTQTISSAEFPGSVERLLSRRRWWPDFVSKVEISGIKRSPTELVYFAISGSLVAALLTQLIFGSILISILTLVIGPLVVRALVNRGARKQRILFQEQLPGQLHEIASAMRTGRSLVEAVGVTAPSADEPMRRELESAVADERAGAHLDEALLPIAERMESSEIEQVAVVAGLHRRTGANITEVLDRVADTARERVEIRRELRALTAQARLSRNILTALPPLVVIAIDLIAHDYEKPLFHTTPGLIVLVLGGLMVATGHWVMKKIVDIEE